MTLSTAFKEQCEGISTKWRDELNLLAYDRLSADLLAQQFHATVTGIHEYKNLPQEAVDRFINSNEFWAGVVTRRPLVILYNPNQSAARYESSIMEELAHIILNHPLEEISIEADVGRSGYNQHFEDEAKYLVSCLLIPRRGLYWAQQKKMIDKQIAKHFGTSIEMVRWRQNMVGR